MENEPIKPYIITDPYYISNEKIRKELPYNATYNPYQATDAPKKPITFYDICGTEGGGSFTYEDQEVTTDNATLCIAYCKEGWNEKLGARFNSLYEAKDALRTIINHF